MADLSTKKDPLHLREERPDYVQDRVGEDNIDGKDYSEEIEPQVNADVGTEDQGSLGVDKPTVTLDPEKVAQAEREGKGFQQSE